MPLVPCESCRRHVRAAEASCPFCKTTRATAIVAAIAGSALLIAGCETFSPASKYGGPPPGYDPPRADVDAAAAVVEPTATAEPPAAPTATPSTTASSPRLSDTPNPDNDRVVAPVAKYGGPPRR
ncbi:MAG: hypothetical protein KIT84_20400 [Labilithrix sp.]|nr:hypothetical protein [Labilithrix sp.]MCW5813401.1 hypothetical protein [Labilithrix sp.]